MNLIKDDIKKLFYKFLIPAISSSLAIAIYSLVDTIAIGQGAGPDGTAACAIVLPIFSLANFIALLCGIGGSILMGHARGEGNKEKGDAYFTSAIILVTILTIIVWIPGMLYQDEFYRLCGADDVLMPYSREYGSWIFAFIPSFVITSFLGAFVRTDGSPKFVMIAILIGGVVNMIGDWIFVFPMNMGMRGAAIATALGSAVQAILILGYVLTGKTTLKLAKPYEWIKSFRKIFVTGFSAGIGSLAIIAVSFIANNQIMKYLGGASLAVYGVLGTVSALFTSIFSGIGQATQPIAAENYGAGNINRCWSVEKLGMRTALIYGIVFAAISIIFPVGVTGIFMQMTPEVREVTPYIMRVFSLSYIPQAVCVFCVYYLQSIVHPKKATVISLLRGVILNGAFLMIFPIFFGGNSIWWAIFMAELVTMLVAIVYMIKIYREHKNLTCS
ncbi:MATE family efflux transporter [Peptacetobacter hiranonis]|uniref:MATE family efflux transporter n=1 Tax=Peptacetobacter hiranonis TaxID=89152 RepID=UPI0022E381BE|nr:MATE family efflux transporter [Peptacetobacter hiranonis]